MLMEWEDQQTDIKTPEYVSLQFQIAGLGSRATAFIIDQLIVGLTITLIIISVFFAFFANPGFMLFDSGSGFIIAGVIIAVFILNYGYFMFFEFFWGGRTIGKRTLGIRVIQDNGHPITLLSSFIRNLLRLIDSLPAGYLIGILFVFLHKKHKRLGDFAAGTLVVHDNRVERKKKKSVIDKIIKSRRLSKDDLVLEKVQLNQFTQQDWRLINKYCERYNSLPLQEKRQVTYQVAEILFPKMDMEVKGQSVMDIENTLFVLYLYLKDEWEFTM
ncbi:hypothetical protein Pryu01_02661 [Paraliobacillus ryukyuensis]|uniref:Putative RDD family membrane protein YckC n=2 Tax=Paraliobacillus ryukyuensis TaxID=200904 RepID=A0A366DYZ6_9BACI|nr:putative RDD family membrane protein YckC [Paraliobacillus ryukyuensis]